MILCNLLLNACFQVRRTVYKKIQDYQIQRNPEGPRRFSTLRTHAGSHSTREELLLITRSPAAEETPDNGAVGVKAKDPDVKCSTSNGQQQQRLLANNKDCA
jgi:hypothetical protein